VRVIDSPHSQTIDGNILQAAQETGALVSRGNVIYGGLGSAVAEC
jgi:transketolase C-terminal domain/subunit